jgi:hypothetical protein
MWTWEPLEWTESVAPDMGALCNCILRKKNGSVHLEASGAQFRRDWVGSAMREARSSSLELLERLSVSLVRLARRFGRYGRVLAGSPDYTASQLGILQS